MLLLTVPVCLHYYVRKSDCQPDEQRTEEKLDRTLNRSPRRGLRPTRLSSPAPHLAISRTRLPPPPVSACPCRAETDIANYNHQLIQILKVASSPTPPRPSTRRRRGRGARGAAGGPGAASCLQLQYIRERRWRREGGDTSHLCSAGSISVFSICVRASVDRSGGRGGKKEKKQGVM